METQWNLEIQSPVSQLLLSLGSKAELTPRKQLSGKSGAYVYLADIAGCHFPSGEYIIKFEVIAKASQGAVTMHDVSSEAARNDRAKLANLKFASEHIPEVVYSARFDCVDITIVRIAEGGIEYIQPLRVANADSFPVLLQHISEDLLTAWELNDPKAAAPMVATSLVMQEWLGNKLDSHSTGPLNKFLAKHGLTPAVTSFVVNGELLPNPASLCQSEGIAESVKMRAIKGCVHGDLHYENILHIPGNGSIYHLIDFSHFELDRPILFDHAYLEVSALLDMFAKSPQEEWISLISNIVGITKPQELANKGLLPHERGLVHPILFIRERVFSWIRKTHGDKVAQLDNQYRLARIAAGINFACKRKLPAKLAINAYIYAALEARDFLKFNKLSLPPANGSPHFTIGSGSSATGLWRDLWKRSLEFDSTRAAYVLCGDFSENTDIGRQIDFIPRLPFCMIIDIANDGSDPKIFGRASSIALKRRAFHVNYPTDQPKLAFDRSTVWLTTLGNASAPASVVRSVAEWRRRYRTGLQRWIVELRTQLHPKHIVIVLAPQEASQLELIERIWEEFDQVFADHLTTVTLTCSRILAEQLPEAIRPTLLDASAEGFREGVLYLQGVDRSQPNAVYLPRRLPDHSKGEVGIHREIFVCEDLTSIRYIEEEFELVHRALAVHEGLDNVAEPAFLRGNEISWSELDASVDLVRDITPALMTICKSKLESYSNDTVEFRHQAGSGGTTVMRRLAWEMKELYPTLILKTTSGQTADRVGELYTLCGLPVLLIADGGVLSSESDREHLFREIRARNIRCLILHVVRGIGTNPKVPTLQDPMGEVEAKRFLHRYAVGLPKQRQAALNQLAFDYGHSRYRSAFFFGLYAFEDKFTHVKDFVKHQLLDMPMEARKALKYVALVSCYAQSPLNLDQLAGLLAIEDSGRDIAEDVISDAAHRLVAISEDRNIRVVHPILAKEILKHELTTSSNDDTQEGWELKLVEIGKELIEGFSRFSTEQDARTNALMEQLFINREPWSESGGTTLRRLFAPLVMDIQDPTSQSVLLEALTEYFPKEPHYWSHRGRHSGLILREKYENAAGFIQEAINLSEGQDPIHHHSLGMVYRSEIRRILLEAKKLNGFNKKLGQEDIEQLWMQIRDLFSRASDCFQRSRRLDPESDYGYITAVQMAIGVIRDLRDLQGYQNVASLIAAKTQIGRWARLAMQDCEQVFNELKDRHAQETASKLSIQCEGDLLELYGDFNGMIDQLRGLLNHPDAERNVTCRLIVNAYLAKRRNNWGLMEPKELRAINELAQQNLEGKEPKDQDYAYWFQSYRRLPEYDDTEARRRLITWAKSNRSPQANYYLYILHFIRWYTGESHDLSAMQRHLDECAVERTSGQKSWSTEWLGQYSSRCQMLHFGELGEWGDGSFSHRFYTQTKKLERLKGMVADISRPQAGEIVFYPRTAESVGRKSKPLRAFFAPGNEFRPGRDENREVEFYLGFSRVGLRAWAVTPAQPIDFPTKE